MHLIVPFAGALSDGARHAMQSLNLTTLESALPLLARTDTDEGDEWSLSPPHERALARALGWAGADGRLPWAALAAERAGIAAGDLAWGLLTPLHLQVGADQVAALDPAALALDETASRTLFDAVAPLFTGDGFVMAWLAPTAWLTAHESLRELPTASIDRVVGRDVAAWVGAPRRLPPALRRLLEEAQMLLHAHGVNAAREARALPAVNTLWLSGCGVRQPAPADGTPTLDERLRAPALAGDWAAWADAWHAIDAGPIAALRDAARRGGRATLTLCGERRALRFDAAARRRWQRWFAPARPRAADVLEAL